MNREQSMQLTCVICPVGCRIAICAVKKTFAVSGNKCYKGIDFAKAEVTSPVRSLTTTVRTVFPDIPVLPVKTNCEVPKDKIKDIIKILSKIVITKKINIGDTVAANILGTGCDIVATRKIG